MQLRLAFSLVFLFSSLECNRSKLQSEVKSLYGEQASSNSEEKKPEDGKPKEGDSDGDKAPSEAVDPPSNFAGALLTCTVIDAGQTKKDATVGCFFKDSVGNRVLPSDFAQSIEFSYKEVKDVTVRVVELTDDRDFDALYHVRDADSSKNLQAAMNLQIIVSALNPDEPPKVIEASVSNVLSSSFLALSNCSNNTCVTLDLKTNLSWSSYQESVFNWDEATNKCDIFNSPDNLSGGWRLPSASELNVALTNGLARENSDTAKYLENKGPDFYLWTSEVDNNDPTQAAALQFAGGNSANFSKEEFLGVICVR